jgi:carboxyl-terminal processing protease
MPSQQRQAPDPGERLRQAFRRFIVTAALIILAFIAGWFGHQFFGQPSYTASSQSQQYAQLFQQAWTLVDQKYVDRKAVNYRQMSYAAIQAMIASLNDKGHTRFLTPDQVNAFNQSLSPTMVGIGVYLSQDPTTKQIKVTNTMPNAPAEKAGIKGGDIIVAVNGQDVRGKDLDFLSKLIRGNAGTQVSVTVQRPSTGQTLTFTITRAQIQIQNVFMHYIPEAHIAHIQVIQFADGVSDQLKTAVQQAKNMGAKSIILDLRGNPGGFVQQAINTVSLFQASGNVFLEQDSTGQRTPYRVNGNPVDGSIPIVVLVDGNTASASEIVSGAFQDNKRAVIIGQKTFGTGTVLEQFPLQDGSAVLLGTGEWLTPNGRFIRQNGIVPDIKVDLKPNQNPLRPIDENGMTYQQILNSGDAQLVRAIEYLNTGK